MMPDNRSASVKFLLLSMSVLAMAACSSQKSPTSKADVPPPPVSGAEEASAQGAGSAPQPLSYDDTLTPVLPAQPATPILALDAGSAVPAASAATDIESRIARLEQAVGSLRSDYDRIMPAFASLNTTNERIQTLLDDIERDAGGGPVAAAAPVTVPVASAAPAVVTPTPAPRVVETAAATKPIEGAVSVSGLRIGEHGAKTRLVLDLTDSSKPVFTYDLDNAEKLLLVDLPATGWAGAQSGKAGGVSPLIESWSVQKGVSGGTSLAIQLKKDARVLSTQFLPSASGSPARLVLDIASGS